MMIVWLILAVLIVGLAVASWVLRRRSSAPSYDRKEYSPDDHDRFWVGGPDGGS